MNANEKTWLKLGDIVNDIVRQQSEIQGKLGMSVFEPNDREAFDILERIEQKIKASGVRRAHG